MALRSLTSIIWYLSNTWMLLNIEASSRSVQASTHSFSRSAGHSNIWPRDEALCLKLLCVLSLLDSGSISCCGAAVPRMQTTISQQSGLVQPWGACCWHPAKVLCCSAKLVKMILSGRPEVCYAGRDKRYSRQAGDGTSPPECPC